MTSRSLHIGLVDMMMKWKRGEISFSSPIGEWLTNTQQSISIHHQQNATQKFSTETEGS
jgi:hypothetical protein